MEEEKVLCRTCGWTTAHETGSLGYTSRLKISYIKDNSALWELGPNSPWMLRDEANNAGNRWKKDYMTQQFIRKEKPNIPLVEVHGFGGPNDKFHFTIISRAKGRIISEIWDILTQEQKKDVLQDLRGWIKEWRQITSLNMQRVDGSEARDVFIGSCTGRGCIKTGRNEEEWIENRIPAMRKALLADAWFYRGGRDGDHDKRASLITKVDAKIAKLMATFPRGGPYVLTHGDLHGDNIFISDDNEEKKFKVTAIIDWELAGFFPWWAEDFRINIPGAGEIPGFTDLGHPEHSCEEAENISKLIEPIKKIWFDGGNHTMSVHKPDESNCWYRQPFCACQPYSQVYRDSKLGLEVEHLDIFDVDSTDSEDDEKDGLKKFPKYERAFLRWFNQCEN